MRCLAAGTYGTKDNLAVPKEGVQAEAGRKIGRH